VLFSARGFGALVSQDTFKYLGGPETTTRGIFTWSLTFSWLEYYGLSSPSCYCARVQWPFLSLFCCA
jgi:hypothetical protein